MRLCPFWKNSSQEVWIKRYLGSCTQKNGFMNNYGILIFYYTDDSREVFV